MRPVETMLVAVASLLALSAYAADGGQTGQGASMKRAPPPAAVPKASSIVRIQAFDCERHEEFPGFAAPSGVIAPGNGIRGWAHGGPSGANWNVDELRCVVRAEAACTGGSIGALVRVGNALVAEQRVQLGPAGAASDFVFRIPLKSWRSQLDQPARKMAAKQPFRTGVFRALVEVACELPRKASLVDERYTAVTAEDIFVAGFAWGE
jgi:hypothetical protein